jgi:hypothetical protein
MKQTLPNGTAEQHVREIRRETHKKYSAEENIRIVISGLRGEHSIAELCRREGLEHYRRRLGSSPLNGLQEVTAHEAPLQRGCLATEMPPTPSATRAPKGRFGFHRQRLGNGGLLATSATSSPSIEYSCACAGVPIRAPVNLPKCPTICPPPGHPGCSIGNCAKL